MKKQKPNNSMDITSRLPIELVQEIQRRLSPEFAIRSSLLSKVWLKAFSTTPYLNFDYIHTHFHINEVSEFLRFVYTTLLKYLHQDLPIEDFALSIYSFDQDLLDRCLHIITAKAKKGVSLFSLSDHKLFSKTKYNIPDSIFAMESLRELRLKNCTILGFGLGIKCSNLKILELMLVDVSESGLHSLISCCPQLTTISLDRCFGLTKFRLPKIAHNLLSLRIITFPLPLEQVHIQAPRLSHFEYEDIMDNVARPLCTLNIHTCTCRSTLNIHTCRNLISLKIRGTTIDDTLLHNLISNLTIIKKLILDFCAHLVNLKISSATLEVCDISMSPNTKQVILDAPNLRSLRVSNRKSQVVPLILQGATKQQCRVKLVCRFGESASWFIEMKKSLSELTHPLELLWTDGCSIDFSTACLRKDDSTPQVENLIVMTDCGSKISCYSTYFDVIFWTCWPKRIQVECDTEFKQFLSGILSDKRRIKNSSNCDDWRGYLVNSRIEYMKLPSDEWNKLEENSLVLEDMHFIRFTPV